MGGKIIILIGSLKTIPKSYNDIDGNYSLLVQLDPGIFCQENVFCDLWFKLCKASASKVWFMFGFFLIGMLFFVFIIV